MTPLMLLPEEIKKKKKTFSVHFPVVCSIKDLIGRTHTVDLNMLPVNCC